MVINILFKNILDFKAKISLNHGVYNIQTTWIYCKIHEEKQIIGVIFLHYTINSIIFKRGLG